MLRRAAFKAPLAAELSFKFIACDVCWQLIVIHQEYNLLGHGREGLYYVPRVASI